MIFIVYKIITPHMHVKHLSIHNWNQLNAKSDWHEWNLVILLSPLPIYSPLLELLQTLTFLVFYTSYFFKILSS